MTSRVKLKICGITRPEDLRSAVDVGVDAVGLNLWPGSKRGLSLEQAAGVVAGGGTRAGSSLVGVFVDPEPDEVERAHRRLGLDLIQLHGDRPIETYAGLGLPYVWVIRGTPSLTGLRVPEPVPSWILLDAWVSGYGGAGRTTDWAWARAAVEHFAPVPVWLAGGLHPHNAARAIARVGPAGLDVASGAELAEADRGQKDRDKIAALRSICHRAEGAEAS